MTEEQVNINLWKMWCFRDRINHENKVYANPDPSTKPHDDAG
jgi:hypothetical protein